jgi:hypothetical protein
VVAIDYSLHSTSLAKSARRERSPRASVMCPPCGQPLKRSTAKVRPDEPFGQVGRVDLRQVAHANDFGARPCAGDQRFHLLGRQVLRLVNDDVLVQEGAPAHEVHALDLDAAADQLVGGRAAPFTCIAVSLGQNSRLSSSAPIQGPIFSSSVPGKKPMSSPTLTVARVMMISV